MKRKIICLYCNEVQAYIKGAKCSKCSNTLHENFAEYYTPIVLDICEDDIYFRLSLEEFNDNSFAPIDTFDNLCKINDSHNPNEIQYNIDVYINHLLDKFESNFLFPNDFRYKNGSKYYLDEEDYLDRFNFIIESLIKPLEDLYNKGLKTITILISLYRLYSNSLYKDRDINKALSYLIQLEDSNIDAALITLSYEYISGEYLDKDLKKAEELLLKCIKTPEVISLLIKLKSNYISDNNEEVSSLLTDGYDKEEYIKKLYDNFSNYDPRFSLVRACLQKDDVLRFNDIKTAADNNVVFAIYLLAQYYEQGVGVDKDINKAIELYINCAEFNISSAMYKLGCIYYYGIDIDIDYDKAFFYLNLYYKNTKIKEKEYKQCYRYGRGIKKSFIKGLF